MQPEGAQPDQPIRMRPQSQMMEANDLLNKYCPVQDGLDIPYVGMSNVELKRLLTVLKTTSNPLQLKQEVINALRSNPYLLAAFMKQRLRQVRQKQLLKHPAESSTHSEILEMGETQMMGANGMPSTAGPAYNSEDVLLIAAYPETSMQPRSNREDLQQLLTAMKTSNPLQVLHILRSNPNLTAACIKKQSWEKLQEQQQRLDLPAESPTYSEVLEKGEQQMIKGMPNPADPLLGGVGLPWVMAIPRTTMQPRSNAEVLQRSLTVLKTTTNPLHQKQEVIHNLNPNLMAAYKKSQSWKKQQQEQQQHLELPAGPKHSKILEKGEPQMMEANNIPNSNGPVQEGVGLPHVMANPGTSMQPGSNAEVWQRLLTDLKTTSNFSQQKQIVIHALRSYPSLMAAFIKMRNSRHPQQE